jgi:hypothetical protein
MNDIGTIRIKEYIYNKEEEEDGCTNSETFAGVGTTTDDRNRMNDIGTIRIKEDIMKKKKKKKMVVLIQKPLRVLPQQLMKVS